MNKVVKPDTVEVWLRECPPHIRKINKRLITAKDVLTLFKDEPRRLQVYVTIDNELPQTAGEIVKGGVYTLAQLLSLGYKKLDVVYRYTTYGCDKRKKMVVSMKYYKHRWSRLVADRQYK